MNEISLEDEGTMEGTLVALEKWIEPTEISPAAREAADKERKSTIGNPEPVGYFVQRAIDAAVEEERKKCVQAVMDTDQATIGRCTDEVARLAKELAEEREKQVSVELDLRQKLAQAERGLILLDKDRYRLRPKIDYLRAQLASVTAERDQASEDRKNSAKGFSVRCDNLESLNDELRRNALSMENERDILQRMLAAAELRIKELSARITDERAVSGLEKVIQERDEARQMVDAFACSLNNVSDTCRSRGVTAGTIRPLDERVIEMVHKIEGERDSLALRVAELEKYLALYQRTDTLCTQGSLIAEYNLIKARCEKLEKALGNFMSEWQQQRPRFSENMGGDNSRLQLVQEKVDALEEALIQSPE